MHRLTLEITAEERIELDKAFRHHPKPHARERAYALIKVSEGLEIQVVASMLPRKRQGRAVSDWVHRYKQEGIASLNIRKGSGRPAAFFPSESGRGQAKVGANAATAPGAAPGKKPLDARAAPG